MRQSIPNKHRRSSSILLSSVNIHQSFPKQLFSKWDEIVFRSIIISIFLYLVMEIQKIFIIERKKRRRKKREKIVF